MIDVESLSIALLSEYSVSPDTSKSQDLLIEALGFRIEKRELHGCRNFWARIGSKGPLLRIGSSIHLIPPHNTPYPPSSQTPISANFHATIVLESETTFTQFRNGLTGLTCDFVQHHHLVALRT